LQKAKAVCIESTEKYKAELARKVEIFLEARVNSVTREAQKQAAIGESKDSKTLSGIKRLIEGVELDIQDGQAVEENKKLRLKVAKLEEGRKALEQKVSRSHGIAKKLLEANKMLTARRPKINESVRRPQKKVVKTVSSKPKTKKLVNEDAVAAPVKRSSNFTSSDPQVNEIAKSIDSGPAYLK
jgi:hypothetical protein